ncbi:hypothetical protein [Lentibacillus cibarius]|uniref:hypothetical protein n=1 Tax=Lentibacillus cibarius TaxID=2583219 RepID=UPI001F485FD1|nr:hypothetical protein [Lentibacillus cibarius]
MENASKVDVASEQDLKEKSVRLPEVEESKVTRAVASRSHMSKETEAFIKELEAKHGEVEDGEVEVVSSGSSSKFCLVAEGKADYYPRYAPTHQRWSGIPVQDKSLLK